MKKTRRKFIKNSGQVALGLGVLGWTSCNNSSTKNSTAESSTTSSEAAKELFFKISLAQWSLHKSLGWNSKEKPLVDWLDFPTKSRELGIGAIEYVSRFIKLDDRSFIPELNKRARNNDVKNLLIMVDDEGHLGDLDDKKRAEAVTNHYKWLEAAKTLGCHSIRVNAAGEGTAKEVSKAAIDGLGKLSEYATTLGLNVIVENHGGYSSDGSWLSNVITKVGMENCGTLPDFGNFCLERGENWSCKKEYDRYKGVDELMPFAKAVSAKANDFDDKGNCIETDYLKMTKLLKKHNYTGFVGIEYEGSKLGEDDGIKATKKLLEKIGRMV